MNTNTLEYTPNPLHEFTLDNGLKVVVREDHRTPQVALTLTFASRGDERPEEFGTGNVLLRALRYLKTITRPSLLKAEVLGSVTAIPLALAN